MTIPTTLAQLFGPNPPLNWGKWGPDDEVGSLNYLTSDEVMRGISAIKTGEVFTLQTPIGSPDADGDPVYPGRQSAVRTPVMDDGFFERGEAEKPADGHRWADDRIDMYLQGSTQYDALGHLWYDGKIWNGYDASTTTGSLKKASVLAIAERGVVGHGVLIDMARYFNKETLETGEYFTHVEVLKAAEAQGVEIKPRDILVLRTGRLGHFFRVPRGEFYQGFNEPGLTWSQDLVEWFQRMEIPNLVTDLIANEATHYPPSPVIELPLHCALMRNLGVAFTEVVWLDDLAEACAVDNRWDFLYTAAPLKVVGASGAPVNPIAIR
jgi:kynurenine formamidase